MHATDLQTGCRVHDSDVRRMCKFDWSMCLGTSLCLTFLGFFWAGIIWGVAELCRKAN